MVDFHLICINSHFEVIFIHHQFELSLTWEENVKVRVKVKFTLEQARKAHMGSTGIALLLLQPRG
jgi:hypothetical protein